MMKASFSDRTANNFLLRSLASVLMAALCSCTALQSTHQVKLDHAQLRDVLLDYHDDQILDNLIRAKHGLPIVHFDFSKITAQVTSRVTPSLAGGRTETDVDSRTPTNSIATTDATTTGTAGATIANTVVKTTAFVGGIVHTVLKPFAYGVTAERANAVNVEMDPVLDDKSVYDAYDSFLRKNPGALMSGKDKPADALLGPKLWRDKQYYWIPRVYGPQLYELGIATVARAKTKSDTEKALDDFNSLERQNLLSRP
jgi:hypothetical protein